MKTSIFTRAALIAGTAFLMATPALAKADFTQFDADGSGGLNFEEFVAFERANDAWKDKNKDGMFSLDEYVNQYKKPNAKRTERLTKKFVKFDKDANGQLDKKEFKRTLKVKFKRLDQDADGEMTKAERYSK